MFVAGWRHALRSEWLFIITGIIIIMVWYFSIWYVLEWSQALAPFGRYCPYMCGTHVPQQSHVVHVSW